MATGTINAKSQSLKARVPHEIVDAMEGVKEDNESTSSFIVSAMEGEIKRRKRKKAKQENV